MKSFGILYINNDNLNKLVFNADTDYETIRMMLKNMDKLYSSILIDNKNKIEKYLTENHIEYTWGVVKSTRIAKNVTRSMFLGLLNNNHQEGLYDNLEESADYYFISMYYSKQLNELYELYLAAAKLEKVSENNYRVKAMCQYRSMDYSDNVSMDDCYIVYYDDVNSDRVTVDLADSVFMDKDYFNDTKLLFYADSILNNEQIYCLCH